MVWQPNPSGNRDDRHRRGLLRFGLRPPLHRPRRCSYTTQWDTTRNTALANTRGQVDDKDLNEIRSAGFSDKEILEIIGLSAQFLLTNMLSGVAALDIDVPQGEYGWMV